jgi:nucleotide-binding universal stress UspA family protein
MAGGLFSKILVPVDFSPCSEEAFHLACTLAREFSSELILLHVVDTKSLAALNRLGLALPSEERRQKKRLSHQARLFARGLMTAAAAKGLPVQRAVREGVPFIEIAKLARAEKVNLVVMGSYGGHAEGVEKIFFGSTAEKVVRTAGCPVLTVPLSARSKPKEGAWA